MAIKIQGQTVFDDNQNINITGAVTATQYNLPSGLPISETIVSETAPSTAELSAGALWWNSDSTDTSLYVLYQDPAGPNGDLGGKYWVEASPSQDTITDTNMLVVGRSTNSSVPISSGSLVIIGRSGDIAVPV